MDKNDEQQALKFVRNAQIMGYFSGSTDTKLSIISHSIKEARAFEAFNHNLAKHETNPLKITNDAIESMVFFDRYPSLSCFANLIPQSELQNHHFSYRSYLPKVQV
ncbi:hypothetical protein Taitung201_11540 [Helicobacter pylori]